MDSSSSTRSTVRLPTRTGLRSGHTGSVPAEGACGTEAGALSEDDFRATPATYLAAYRATKLPRMPAPAWSLTPHQYR